MNKQEEMSETQIADLVKGRLREDSKKWNNTLGRSYVALETKETAGSPTQATLYEDCGEGRQTRLFSGVSGKGLMVSGQLGQLSKRG